MLRDLSIAFRGLRRSPGFTVAATVTLALGIGANTTMFSVVDGVLLRPLPGYQTDRVVTVCHARPDGCFFLPPEIYQRLHDRLRSFAALAANQNCRMNLTGHGEAEQIDTPCATANWFDVQHAQAMLGRTFLPDEDQHGRNRVVVLDNGYWQRRFGSDPRIVGKALTLDKEPCLVVGVMPRGFAPVGSASSPLYTPYVVADNPHGLNVTGRLKPGISLTAAQAELTVAAAQLAGENPDWHDYRLQAVPLLERVSGGQRPMLLLLLGAVSFVLLIACANVANLLLARGAARQHEIDIRLALGATRSPIVRFVMAEAFAIAGVASLAAVAIAYAGLRALSPLMTSLPRVAELTVDTRVLAAALLLGCTSALLFGLLPAIRPIRVVRSRSTAKSQGLLVAAEVALAFVLLMGAGLLLRTFAAIRATDLGYNPRNVLTHFLALEPSADGTRTAGAALYSRIRERLKALPGVRAVATASALPMFGVQIQMDVHPEGEPERHHEHTSSLTVISEDYFRALEIPLRAGRSFDRDDRDGSPRVAVVSESIAGRYFGGKPVGRRIVLPEFLFNIDGGKDVTREIVGVVGNVCQGSIEDCQAEHIYLPESQNALRMENLVVRTEGDPMAAENAIRTAMRAEAPSVPLDEAQTLASRTSYLIDVPRRAMWLLGVFAGLAVLLAAAGIYSVSAYLTARRSREIGIRMALGAGFTDIARLVYRGVLAPSALGLAVGMGAAFWLTRFAQSLLFGVRANDPKTFLLAAAVLLAIPVLAAAVPAVRAASADPATVLRRD